MPADDCKYMQYEVHRNNQRPGAGRSGRQLQQVVASAASEENFEISPLDSFGISQDLSGRFAVGWQTTLQRPTRSLIYYSVDLYSKWLVGHHGVDCCQSTPD